MRIRQPDQQRDRGEENADRPAQPDPRDERLFPPCEAKRRETQEHGRGPRDKHERRSHRKRRQDGLDETPGPHQQAEQHEHHDLCEPGHGIEKHHHRIVGACRAVADYEAGKIDGEKTRGVQGRGEAEDDERARGHERRVQPLRQPQPVEHDHDGAPADDADDGAEHGLLGEHGEHVLPRAIADREEADEEQSEQNRKRIVAAGFDLEGGADARAQAQSAGMKQKEYRRGIGRGHDRADQQRLGPAHGEQIFGDRRGQRRRQQDPGGRERDRRPQHAAEGREPRAQAAVEQDERQCDRADHVGGAHVVELEAARSSLAREHADDEEHEQERRAEAHRHQARHDARQHQEGAEQNADAECVESGHRVRIPPPIGNAHAPRGNC